METSATMSLATLPADARVWIYKSADPITAEQAEALAREAGAFTEKWKSHGESINGVLEVIHDHFLVVGAANLDARLCGGAIDASTRFIRRMEEGLGLKLTDRMVVLYEKDGGIASCHASELESLVKSGELTGDTIVYNDLVERKGDLDARFRAPLRDTWMARYL